MALVMEPLGGDVRLEHARKLRMMALRQPSSSLQGFAGDADWTWQWRPKGYAYRNRSAMTMVEPSSTLMGFGQESGVMDWMSENKWYLLGGAAVLGVGYYGYRKGWFGGRRRGFGTVLNLSGRRRGGHRGMLTLGRPRRRGMRGIVELGGSSRCTKPVWKSTKRGRRCVSRCGRLWRFRKNSACR